MSSPFSSALERSLPTHWVDLHADQHSPTPTMRWERQLHAIAGALFEENGQPPPEDRLNWLVYQIRDLLEQAGGRGALVYRLSLFVVAWVAPFFVFRFPTVIGLSQENRVKALLRVEHSPLKMMLFALKALLCIVYFEHPDAAQQVAFDGRGLLEGDHDPT